jgi:hypothetical protein
VQAGVSSNIQVTERLLPFDANTVALFPDTFDLQVINERSRQIEARKRLEIESEVHTIALTLLNCAPILYHSLMDSSLYDLWHTAAGSPFNPTIPKRNQLTLGFLLVVFGVILTGFFALSMPPC